MVVHSCSPAPDQSRYRRGPLCPPPWLRPGPPNNLVLLPKQLRGFGERDARISNGHEERGLFGPAAA